MRLLAVLAGLGVVNALRLTVHHQPRAPRSTRLLMQQAFPNPFEDLMEKPKTWTSPNWNWGSADGDAHEVAMRGACSRTWNRALCNPCLLYAPNTPPLLCSARGL